LSRVLLAVATHGHKDRDQLEREPPKPQVAVPRHRACPIL